MGKIGISIGLDVPKYLEIGVEPGLKILKEAGFEYVELGIIDGHCILQIAGFCPVISADSDPIYWKEKLEEIGLKSRVLSSHASLLEPEFGIRYLKRAIRFASDMGLKVLVTSEGPTPRGMSEQEGYQMINYCIQQLIPVAEHFGIILAIEPHGEFTVKKEGIKRISEMSNSPCFGINFDTGNTFLGGSDPVGNLKAVLDKVVHMHAKDIGGAQLDSRGKVTGTPTGVVLGKGVVDIKTCVNLLKKRGYEGLIHIEAGKTVEEIKESKAYLESLLKD